MRIRARTPLLSLPLVALLAAVSSCAKPAATTPPPIPATPAARCGAAHDRVVSLVDSAIPEDEDEVHDVLSDLAKKDQDGWTTACMADQAKEAPCAVQASKLADVDACNGTAQRAAWPLRVGVGECAAMFAHAADIMMSSQLEGREPDGEMRNQLREQLEKSFSPDDADVCGLLSHADVACFLAARDMKQIAPCKDKIHQDSPEFVEKMKELASESKGTEAVTGGE